MARESLTHLCVFLLLIFFFFFFFTSTAAVEKKEKECLDKQEGSVLIPGIGRYMPGSNFQAGHGHPSIAGLDHSGPAAAHPRYIPGNDDTFVPNPGYEVPRHHKRKSWPGLVVASLCTSKCD